MISKNEIKLIRALKGKKERDKTNLFVAEGVKLVEHLLTHGIQQKYLFFNSAYRGGNTHLGEQITDAEMKQISLLDTASPLFGVFHKPNKTTVINSNIIVALDDIRDPGNMGTIIRLADWFGVKSIICSQNCVDIYNPKTVQSTMGSIANVNITSVNLAEKLSELKKEGYKIIGAEMNGTDMKQFTAPEKWVLVMGNEAHGINEETKKELTQSITIAKSKSATAESLNVATATAILLGNLIN